MQVKPAGFCMTVHDRRSLLFCKRRLWGRSLDFGLLIWVYLCVSFGKPICNEIYNSSLYRWFGNLDFFCLVGDPRSLLLEHRAPANNPVTEHRWNDSKVIENGSQEELIGTLSVRVKWLPQACHTREEIEDWKGWERVVRMPPLQSRLWSVSFLYFLVNWWSLRLKPSNTVEYTWNYTSSS